MSRETPEQSEDVNPDSGTTNPPYTRQDRYDAANARAIFVVIALILTFLWVAVGVALGF